MCSLDVRSTSCGLGLVGGVEACGGPIVMRWVSLWVLLVASGSCVCFCLI